MSLVRELTDVIESLGWRAWDDNPRFNFGAILGPPDSEEAPVAWARLLVPEESTRRYGRDVRCAYLVLYVEPRSSGGASAPAASLVSWYQRFSQALRMPAALAEFLAQQLGLSTSDDPLAEVGIWLKAPRALTELVDVTGFASVPGSAQSNWFMGFAVADPDGQPMLSTAEAWLRHMCDSSLHLDGYEEALTSLGTESTGVPRLVVRVVDNVWDSWRQIAYIVSLKIEITNTTDVVIGLGLTVVGGDWDANSRGELPAGDSPEGLQFQQDIDALRRDRYAPDLLSSYAYVLPHESVSGWVVTGAPLPSTGGAPSLTVSVREAVGYQYRLVIPGAESLAYRSLADFSAEDRADVALRNNWESRDLPVLAAVVRMLDEAHYPLARVNEIAEACGLSVDEVAAAVRALDGTYLTLKTTLGEPGSWFVTRLTSAARQAVGQWPH